MIHKLRLLFGCSEGSRLGLHLGIGQGVLLKVFVYMEIGLEELNLMRGGEGEV